MPVPARRRSAVLWTIVASSVVVGMVLIAVALRAQVSAPTPTSAGRIDPPRSSTTPREGGAASPSGGSATTRRKAPAPLAASRPLSISIPAIDLTSRVNPIGLAEDGTIAVPQPGPLLDQAAWFQNSPTPGQPGPAIIEGHVDTEVGPSVFFELGKVAPGQRVLVTRADSKRLTFTVDAVRDYLKSRFPTEVVYGAQDLSTPALRLITCSQFDPATRHHEGNQVVFAHLTHVDDHPATS